MPVLTSAARLPNKLTFDLRGVPDALAICHLWFTDICLNAELPAHTVHNDIEVKFTHPGDDGLPGFFICLDAERGIFLCKLRQRQTHLFLIGLRSRLYRNRNNGLRKLHSLEDNGIVRVAERIACGHIFEANRSGNITRQHFFNFFATVGVHLNHTADALLLSLHGVEDGIT